MRIIGIVCEYNPFHKGHEYQIAKSRELVGEDAAVVCVMSGDFVQRGEAALFSKYARAEAACRCGADLVAELPIPWAVSSAEGFARGAVSILAGLGAEFISFGSESGDISKLEKIADCLLDTTMHDKIKAEMDRDASLSYASARQKALFKTIGATSALISEPNNILAVEYIKAIKELGLSLKPLTVRREGVFHDAPEKSGGFASASELRRMIEAGEDCKAYIPEAAYKIFKREMRSGRIIDRDRMDTAVLSRLRSLSENDFEMLRDGENGVGRRIFRAVSSCSTLDDIAQDASTKRYAFSRIKRMCICAALGIGKIGRDDLPKYTRVLAATDRGFSVLRECGGGDLTIITKPAHARAMSVEIAAMSASCANAHDMYVLAYMGKEHRNGGEDWKTGPVIVHND